MRRAAIRNYAWIALAAFTSCARLPACGDGAVLAEVIEAQGRVERDFAAQREQWQRADKGAELMRGDGLRTGPDAKALLRVGDGGTLRVEPETTLRMQLPGDAQEQSAPMPDVDIESGSAMLEAGAAQLPVRTRFGTAVLQAGARVKLSRGDQGVRYQVTVGMAAFKQNDGKTVQVNAGQSITVGIGMAVLETVAGARPQAGAGEPALAATVVDAGTAATADAGADAGARGAEEAAAVQAVISGAVRRRSSGARDWKELDAGATTLGAGDELELHEDGVAELTRGDERARLRRGHYEIGAQGAPIVRARDGELTVSAERSVVVISVPGGTIVAEPAAGGSRANVVVNAEDGSTAVEVLGGRVKTVSEEGENQLAEGERTTLEAPRAAGAKRATAAPRTAEHPDLVVSAGETFRVYDPDPPTALGLNLGKRCADRAELRVEGIDPVRGSRQINLLVGPGLRNYAVHCVTAAGNVERRPATTGSLRVLRTDGTRRPPTTPARNDVDLDGRQYTLMYQNLRPILYAVWPNAAKASSYTLRLKRPDGSEKSVASKRPLAVIEPSMLGDGVHALKFIAAGPEGASSKETLVKLVFDNAAPTASLSLPAAAGFVPGATTTVSGVAVAGSTASVGEQSIALDKGGRFSAEVRLRPGQRTLAIRFKHAKHGIRYYLRRAVGDQP